jgi:plasmid stability protein
MSSSITIRDIPEDSLQELKVRAARSGQSLQEYMRSHIVSFTSKPDMAEWIERVTRQVKASGVKISTEDILRYKDMDRR